MTIEIALLISIVSVAFSIYFGLKNSKKSDKEEIVARIARDTKTEINRMSTAELQTLALENGIDGADEMTGAELKKVLIEKFGL